MDYSSWGHKKLDTTGQLTFHFFWRGMQTLGRDSETMCRPKVTVGWGMVLPVSEERAGNKGGPD